MLPPARPPTDVGDLVKAALTVGIFGLCTYYFWQWGHPIMTVVCGAAAVSPLVWFFRAITRGEDS